MVLSRIESSLRLDDTGFGNVQVWQSSELFCYGVDAVLLASFAADDMNTRKRKPNKIMDLCTGNGIVPLILSHKTEAKEIFGMEILEESFKLAEKNVIHNELSDRIRMFHMDVAEVIKQPGDFSGYFDAVTCNPPYAAPGDGIVSGNLQIATARHESTAGVKEFIELSFKILKDKGDLYMVHRPSRLTDIIFYGREMRMEPKEILFVSGQRDTRPNIVLVHMVKFGGRELHVLPQIYTREPDGTFSTELLRIYERL